MTNILSIARNAFRLIQGHVRKHASVPANMSDYHNFSANETWCKCGCNINNVSKLLMDMLQAMRTLFGRPINISSCCRCPAHNANVGGRPNSFHIATPNQLTRAVDIVCINNTERFWLVLYALLVGFKRIIIYPRQNFIHLDIGERDENILSIM